MDWISACRYTVCVVVPGSLMEYLILINSSYQNLICLWLPDMNEWKSLNQVTQQPQAVEQKSHELIATHTLVL